jgi:hypothetical protein
MTDLKQRIITTLHTSGVPMMADDIAAHLGMPDPTSALRVGDELLELMRQGRTVQNHRYKWRLTNHERTRLLEDNESQDTDSVPSLPVPTHVVEMASATAATDQSIQYGVETVSEFYEFVACVAKEKEEKTDANTESVDDADTAGDCPFGENDGDDNQPMSDEEARGILDSEGIDPDAAYERLVAKVDGAEGINRRTCGSCAAWDGEECSVCQIYGDDLTPESPACYDWAPVPQSDEIELTPVTIGGGELPLLVPAGPPARSETSAWERTLDALEAALKPGDDDLLGRDGSGCSGTATCTVAIDQSTPSIDEEFEILEQRAAVLRKRIEAEREENCGKIDCIREQRRTLYEQMRSLEARNARLLEMLGGEAAE